MRRKNPEKTRKTNVLLMGIFIIALMVFSSFAVIDYGSSSSLSYNGFKFKQDPDSGALYTKINGVEVPFSEVPEDVLGINLSREAVELFSSAQQVYMTFDPEEERYLRLFDTIRLDFTRYSGKNIIGATTSPSQLYAFSVRNCSNATKESPVIYLKVGSQTRIVQEGSCIVFESEELGFVKLRDRFYFGIFGVIEDEKGK